MRKPVSGFLTRCNTKRAVKPQKMARGLKFLESGGIVLYLCNKIKGADQLPRNHAANLRLCLRICKKQVFS